MAIKGDRQSSADLLARAQHIVTTHDRPEDTDWSKAGHGKFLIQGKIRIKVQKRE